MPRGLSTAELKTIKDTLATGRKPKVMFTESAGQIAGQVGQVTKLTDPGLSDEWVVVRFGRDELPFSPNDLSVPARAPKVPAGKRGGTAPVEPAPEFRVIREIPGQRADAGARRPTGGGTGSADRPATAAPHKPEPGGSVAPPAAQPENPTVTATAGTPSSATAAAPASPASPVGNGAAPAEPTARPSGAQPDGAATGGAKPARRAAGRTGKAKPVPGLTVTLAYADGEWTVAASQGSKVLAKPYLIKASEALRMVSLLDVPGVHEAVEQIVTAERNEAQARAERLRAELAQIEQRLAELDA